MQRSDVFRINVDEGKNFFFLSDFHLKSFGEEPNTEEREQRIVDFISGVEDQAAGFMFLGDVFDFWMEYKKVIPKGNIRIQAKWLALKDKGIPTYLVAGNHDRWTFGYLENYLGIKVFIKPQEFLFNEKIRLFVGHGDGLGKSDKIYKVFKFLVTSSLGLAILKYLPSRITYSTAHHYIAKKQKAETPKERLSDDKEWLIQFATAYLKNSNPHIDYFLFGHRHIPIEHRLPEGAVYINTGDWINHNSYAVFNDNKITLVKKHT